MSQKDRLLERLQATPGEWVSICELARAMSPSGEGGQGTYVGRRIFDLRRAGHDIEHQQWRLDGQMHSSYRISPDHGSGQSASLPSRPSVQP